MVDKKNLKNEINKEMTNVGSEAKNFLDRLLGDVSKKSATKQILIGAGTGWATGFLTMKVGKVVAVSVGGSIILLQIAANEGYIKIDWNKLTSKANKLADKAEEAITGEGPSWADKADRFVDRKLNQAEDLLKKKGKSAKKWYSNFIGDANGPKLNEFHIFVISFAAGVALGIGSA
ncbi:CLUMA_CG015000, isoform A [Clunio marinus]|uniref:CLUMA_CG015000, isoform A n=1 Tax=Clunio marinus TaxID=568069 RepID=A0A1J1INP7_9DIPT|nr:CLUMA_CG015000, isoform A [Clunio marinus]